MKYCPKCGASLTAETARRPGAYEKEEKQEKEEKHEKEETSRFWALIGGLFLVLVGVVSIITAFVDLPQPWRGALWLIIVGAVIMVVAIYMAIRASGRSPRP